MALRVDIVDETLFKISFKDLPTLWFHYEMNANSTFLKRQANAHLNFYTSLMSHFYDKCSG